MINYFLLFFSNLKYLLSKYQGTILGTPQTRTPLASPLLAFQLLGIFGLKFLGRSKMLKFKTSKKPENILEKVKNIVDFVTFFIYFWHIKIFFWTFGFWYFIFYQPFCLTISTPIQNVRMGGAHRRNYCQKYKIKITPIKN